MTWTGDRVATLRNLWADGETASAIATKLGAVTRNAVIGKVHRLGLAARAGGARKREGSRAGSLFPARPPTSQTRGRHSRRRSSPPRAKALRSLTSILPELGPPPDLPVTVQTLTERSCRWPEGDPKLPGFHFCGRLKTESPGPYCGAHAAIAFR